MNEYDERIYNERAKKARRWIVEYRDAVNNLKELVTQDAATIQECIVDTLKGISLVEWDTEDAIFRPVKGYTFLHSCPREEWSVAYDDETFQQIADEYKRLRASVKDSLAVLVRKVGALELPTFGDTIRSLYERHCRN